MATAPKTGHDERTASQPRRSELHDVTIKAVENVNQSIRTYRLASRQTISFLPGQWLDVHIHGLPKPGGFTITSSPLLANLDTCGEDGPSVDLAIQASPENPAAEWLWKPEKEIVGQPLRIRVGGSFVWPPEYFTTAPRKESDIQNVVFIAGGVGINPLMAMIRHLGLTDTMPPNVNFLYSVKAPPTIPDEGRVTALFLDDLVDIARTSGSGKGKLRLKLFSSNYKYAEALSQHGAIIAPRRIRHEDLLSALGDKKESTVCYVCGPPDMTDQFVEFLQGQDGLEKEQVLCEKWW
ncbi:hypothetical protein BT63DRAFT_410401 [Microthyrium microscopicum]|uniref:FAD-binding FR-type domain-containing protein n=1 Tax=Microthyrium microscopicum TaxID=703497 RepID=A0A6A6UQM4_9PEZI|nr:hypothetical protein BT63DRAFT_410401 [Microthyrium microscopicum]